MAVAGFLLAAWPARAEDSGRAPATKPQAGAGKRELNFFPIVGGDSDVGIGGGQFSNWAKLGVVEGSFDWKIEDAVFVTFKRRGDGLIIPFIDVFARLTLPRIGPGGRFRLEVRPSYTDERTLGYYGIGNASTEPAGLPDAATEYRRTHPSLGVKLRVHLLERLFLSVGSVSTGSWLTVRQDSFLAREQATGSPTTRRLLGSFASHALQLIDLGVEYDTRDEETATGRGHYHMLLARVSPALGAFMPYQYVQLNATFRFYSNPIPRWLFLSFRLVGDIFLGDPPFYELARFENTPAIGGGKAIRGIPAQRYHGKVKLFQNLEARSEILPFRIRNKLFVLGVAAFFDAGRSWTEPFTAHPDLDGRGWGLKYGVGGGPRLQQGKTFIVRADLAWSPDARPLGAYVDAAQVF